MKQKTGVPVTKSFTIRKLLTAVGLGAALTMPGIANAQSDEKKLVAIAEDLDPPSIVVERPQPIVKVTRVGVLQSPPQGTTGTPAVGGLTGSVGYAKEGGNCVLEVPAGIRPNGNPITWAVTSQQPHIGSVALFRYNHVGVVSGIWANGDLEIRHQNFSANIHRFPRNTFRGFR